jgi:hypothetical protein
VRDADEQDRMAEVRTLVPATTDEKPTFWGIEYERNPNPTGEPSGLLAIPLPWDEDDGYTIRAAVLVYETHGLAETGLDHYLVKSGASAYCYGLLPFSATELADALEARPEGGGFDHVALNPVPSRHFPGTTAYAAGWTTEEFVSALRGL